MEFGTIRRRKKVEDSLAMGKKIRQILLTDNIPFIQNVMSVNVNSNVHIFLRMIEGKKLMTNCGTFHMLKEEHFVLYSCEHVETKRRTTTDGILSGHHSRNNVYKYNLKDSRKNIHVCKHFYLSILGYKSTNVRFVFEILSKTPKGSITPLADKSGKSCPANFIPKTEIDEHIES